MAAFGRGFVVSLVFLGALLAGPLAGTARADEFPSRPLKIIVPTSAATTSDLSARFLAEKLGRELRVPVVVENRPGSNGILAVSAFLAAPHDGYTLLLGYSGLYANAALYKRPSYDPVRDFRVLAGVNEVLLVLVAAPSYPASTIGQLVALARTKPDGIDYASSGIGSSTHLGPELLANRSGIKLHHIPYKSGTQAVDDVASGEVAIAMAAIPTVLPLLNGGRLKALAVTGAQRSRLLTSVPTLAEGGIAGAEITSNQTLVVPADAPEAAARRLTAAIRQVILLPDYAAFLQANGIDPETRPQDEIVRGIAAEQRRWKEIVGISGATFD